MMEAAEIQPWCFKVEPYEGESISHFLGRFRRANQITPSGLGKRAGLGAVISHWEKFRFIPAPTEKQLEALARVVEVDTARIRQMVPPTGVEMKLEPIRLCGSCYSENPCHRIEWQFQTTRGCELHRLRLLSKCPRCEAKFQIPVLWEYGDCRRCRLLFGEMGQHQKTYQ
jgi:TniQ